MEIQEIRTELLNHHPDNPRKDYGDISELVESVRERGILQPLTVVRIGTNKYFNVVAGNRRLEAAKKAGLEECPCIVSDMSDKEQASLMLIENMQRKDLNPYEQFKGVQLCLDLGMTEKDIAKKTGLSKDTIRHRKKLADLDEEKLRTKCSDGQISMQELISLEKIRDPETRNKVLDDIGTNNFNYSLAGAIRDEAAEADRETAYNILLTFAEEMPADWADNAYRQDKYGITGEFEKPEDADTADYVFRLTWSNAKSYCLYKRREDVEDEEEPEESPYEVERRKRNEAVAKLHELAATFYEMRKEYMIKSTEFHGNAIQWLVYLTLQDEFAEKDGEVVKPEGFDYSYMYMGAFNYKLYAELMGDTEPDEYKAEDVVEDMSHELQRTIDGGGPAAAAFIYSMIEVGPDHRLGTWQGEYDGEHEEMKRLYDFMELCGYELSDAEKQVLDGTHEYYYTED